MKICSNCNISKDLSNFVKNKRLSDGLNIWCKQCTKEYKKQYYISNKQVLEVKKKKYIENNREKTLLYKKNYRAINISYYKQYMKDNAGKFNAISMKRYAAKLKRTPPWLTKEHYKEIEEYYSLCKELQWLSNDRLEVDHIVPLQGENVSGLHVPWNLQILTRSLNASKRNKFIDITKI